ncbi:Phenylacetate-coenzyme A ligase [Fundidesulfovibrio magnetotacticus]|uniref:Phenylacetate-coenzyme A ligase n=1 Tax=Fundidesulfovibrio magnetotacticus TaxID=2730080 RepID=A0A6V8LV06_9BACT|nr:phenylacetate--CoA ligase [Fundidesulfovibrio magnetotacticus]GFK93497.1 Phenylacetate-coenzyme A ligase [Fundidesulfovibrio magnetotacticus]
MMWEPKFEAMDRAQLAQLQLERLQSTLTRVARNVPYYRKTFAAQGIDPDDFRSLADLARLPFTTKAVLREAYPYGFFAVPLREVVRLHASSGTTGKATVVGYTATDLKKWGALTARILTMGGVTREDVVQIAFSFGLFTGGFGFHQGAETLGAAVVPASSGNTRRQVAIMQDFKTSVLVCTPSYALYLAQTMEDLGVNANALSLRRGLFGAEGWTEAARAQIEDRLKLTATDNYGLSEVMGPGVAGECLQRNGLHLNEDHFLAEIVDPATGEPVADGELGELVITTLAKEAFPLVRFRTGDLTRFLPGPCPCGRTFRRMERVRGRVDDMLIIRGVNVFPAQIESVLLELEGATPHWRVVLEREKGLDKATVELEVAESFVFDRIADQQRFLQNARKRLASELGVSFEIRMTEPGSLACDDGKPCRVLDRRGEG